MERLLLVLVTMLSPLLAFAQKDHSARLFISGGISELGVSPTEEIWAATRAGNVYYTKQVGQGWQLGPFGSLERYNHNSGQTFERVNFFTQDTMMISGFIQDNGNENFVYWSGDHGQNWEKIVFGKSSWLDAAFVNQKGKAWMSGSSQLIYYTEDRGKSWTSFDKVEKTGNLRFSAICFADDEKTGLFGSTWNVLYRTNDNCRSWQKLPTPLTQKKYKRVSRTEHPDIRKIRIFGNHYIINQEGRTFITDADNVAWRYLPSVLDFEVTEKEQLYTINKNLMVDLFDNNFNKVWASTQAISDKPLALASKNQKLFVLTSTTIYKISSREFISSDLLVDDAPIPEPELKIKLKDEMFGFEDRDVLRFDKKNARWSRYITLDFSISNAVLFNGHLLVADKNLNTYFEIDEHTKSVREFKFPKELFPAKQVVELHFENGSQGCFSADNARRVYKRSGNDFIFYKKRSSPYYLKNMDSKIGAANIDNIVKTISDSRFLPVSISDLNISASDVTKFKHEMDIQLKKFKQSSPPDLHNFYMFPGEDVDITFYKAIADSLSSLPTEVIDQAFTQASGIWSTTTNWRRAIFVFKDGKKLYIENSDYQPNYLYTPWIVNYEGLKFRTPSIRIGQHIKELTDGQFFDDTASDKSYAIFRIADYLYRKKISEE